MGRVLLILVVIVAVVWLLRPRRRQAAPPATSAAGGTRDVVACAHCGVHLPKDEAVVGASGLYCSEAHRLEHVPGTPPTRDRDDTGSN